MILGAQWYVLFNTIAGAMAVPNDLREMASNMQLTGWPLWRKLILPAIFPAWVSGAISQMLQLSAMRQGLFSESR